MNKICWKGKAFKALSYGKHYKKAGRNFSGSITIFHRGGGAKRLLRRIDFQRKNLARGFIERIEYDPNRTARIALVRWSNIKLDIDNYVEMHDQKQSHRAFPWYPLPLPELLTGILKPVLPRKGGPPAGPAIADTLKSCSDNNASHLGFSRKRPTNYRYRFGFIQSITSRIRSVYGSKRRLPVGRRRSTRRGEAFGRVSTLKKAFSYILASDNLKWGDEILNIDTSMLSDLSITDNRLITHPNITLDVDKGTDIQNQNERASPPMKSLTNLYQTSGISLPLLLAPIGSVIHNIELCPGGGGKLARAAGTSAQLVKKEPQYPEARRNSVCTIRLPSGQQQLLDLRCRATIGVVSNIDHRARTLRKAGQRRWLGFRPVVRGVAMNPIDHPHGGGEGRTKGGRPSVSPWGKPTKDGFRVSVKGSRKGHK